jgi:carbonic anhydrase/acetyltransferase-like protein (isoleucine patch superfamily)
METISTNKKYKLVNESSYLWYKTYQVEALKDFADVKKGDKGGRVCSEDNLSQEGNCWVYDNALVINDAKVLDNAQLRGDARLENNAILKDNAIMDGESLAFSYVIISRNAEVHDNAFLCGHSVITDNAKVLKGGTANDYSRLTGNSILTDHASIHAHTIVMGNAVIDQRKHIYSTEVIEKSEDVEIFDIVPTSVPKPMYCGAEHVVHIVPTDTWHCKEFEGNEKEFIKFVNKTFRVRKVSKRKTTKAIDGKPKKRQPAKYTTPAFKSTSEFLSPFTYVENI